jgi:hypothetical protein
MYKITGMSSIDRVIFVRRPAIDPVLYCSLSLTFFLCFLIALLLLSVGCFSLLNSPISFLIGPRHQKENRAI